MARLLVVDDEPSMRVFLEVLLTKAGHQVQMAGDVAEAQRAFGASEFDLVLTDLRLGKKSGLDLLKKVKADKPETEVIVMTAFASDEGDRRRCGWAPTTTSPSPSRTTSSCSWSARRWRSGRWRSAGGCSRRTTSCSASGWPSGAGSSRWWATAPPCRPSSR